MQDLEISTAVGCSRVIAEQLRRTALDGLLALPRVGMGVGGFLLGTREEGRIRILDAVEIPCRHSDGPAFVLTAEEKAEALELAKASPGKVVGWYCSKPRGPSVLSESVTELFGTLCPEEWQILLLLRPSTVEASRAVLFVRDAAGRAAAAAERELDAVPEAGAAELATRDEVSVAAAAGALPAAANREPEADSVLAGAVMPRPELNIPMSLFPQAAPRHRGPLIFALAVLALAAAGIGWSTRDNWLPRPPLTMAAKDAKGYLTLRWNADAVRGETEAVLSINDGGDLKSYPLDRFALERGWIGYARKSPRVTATLRVGETRAIAMFTDPAPPAPPAAAPAAVKPLKKAAPKKTLPRVEDDQ